MMRPRIEAQLRRLGKVAVAYSGGVDSTLLLALAKETLGAGNVLALTTHAQMHAAREIALAKEVTRTLGVEHIIMPFDLFSVDGLAHNSKDRCYLCKKTMFAQLLDLARERGFDVLCDGTNLDDEGDYRPGMRAVRELGVVSPLRDAGMSKAAIRALSREMGLPTADLPALSCLATRIPTGTPITQAALARIDRAEEALLAMGFGQLRVRDHGTMARIEVEKGELEAAFAQREGIVAALRAAGYATVALDLEGYQMGKMNQG